MQSKSLIVFGRFPPPIDGQSMLTKRFASLMPGEMEVIRINTIIEASASSIAKYLHYYRKGRALSRHASQDPDAIIVWHSISAKRSGHFRDFLTVLPSIRRNRSVAVVHWGKFDTLNDSPWTRWTAAILGRALDRIVFNTERLSEACSDWLSARQRVVIPNSVDEETLCSEAEVHDKRQRRPNSPFRVLYLSNMIREKGYLDVLEAARLVHREYPDVLFDFAGAWSTVDDRREFEAIVARYGLGDVVTHHGAVSDRSEVKRLHLESQAFVLPSYHFAEAQPLSMIEGLSAGTPAICSTAGGIAEVVADGKEALFVPVQSPEAIRDAIERLLDENTWLAMSLRARKRFLETYHPTVVRAEWLKLFDSLDSGVAEGEEDE